MAVIKEYMHGGCRVVVHDDFIQPPEEVKEIISRVSELVVSEALRKSMAESSEKGKGKEHEYDKVSDRN